MTDNVASMILAVIPEIGLAVLIALVLVLDVVLREKSRPWLSWVVAFGLLVIGVLAAVFALPGKESVSLFGGMLRLDGLGFVFRLVFLTGASITALLTADNVDLGHRGEFYALLLTSTLGMCLMASAGDLIMLYLAIETTSIPLYVLAGFLVRDPKSVEAGLKYLLFGAMTSAVMLYGFSLLFGFTGTTDLYHIGKLMISNQIPLAAALAGVMLVLVGFSFKISAAPFHFWAPDVYEGAPTPVAGFLSTASKAAGFAVVMRVLFIAFPDWAQYWTILIAILATASMIIGNFLALAQKNIKRLLAYSSIAQAGYILIGVTAHSELGMTGVTYYLVGYLLTNLAAFGIVAVAGRAIQSDEIASYAGLSRRSPVLALGLLAALLSLGGVPPFAGFVGKVLVFASAMQSGWLWLAIVGIINSVIGLYYYLNVLKVVYLYRSENEDQPVILTTAWKTALILCAAGIIALGVLLSPFYNLSTLPAIGIM